MQDFEKEIKTLEEQMADPNFWADKEKAQNTLKELAYLKEKESEERKLEAGPAIVTIFAGAGGDDAEDFTAMLFNMYSRFAENHNFSLTISHQHKNDHDGYRNITFTLTGKGAFRLLKNESGVHRLVRISPFNAKKLRHTSFAMVEVIPKFPPMSDVSIPPDDLKIEFARSSGPGGQNVNKRETAVRIVHTPTGIAVHVESERSQAQNKEEALAVLKGKLYRHKKEQEERERAGLYVSKTTENEWGSQIRSYILHPYKLVKDHRTDKEDQNPEKVLQGDLSTFIEEGPGGMV
jgi:peptide chain release factor 2